MVREKREIKMGNCLSKNIEPLKFKHDNGCGAQVGINTERRVYALGFYLQRVKHITTPVEDRFPPQSCDLKTELVLTYKKPKGYKILLS